MVEIVVGEGDGETKDDGEHHHEHQQDEARGDHQIREPFAQQQLVLLAHTGQRYATIPAIAVNIGVADAPVVDGATKDGHQYADNPLGQEEDGVVPGQLRAEGKQPPEPLR